MAALIGITAGEIYNKIDTWSPVTYGQSATYCDAIIRAGGVPVILPITTDQTVLRELYGRIDGLMLAGGNDVSPALYDEKPYPTTKDISDDRDACEVQLLSWALGDQKPVFGICRGMHLMNVLAGGSLYQHIPRDLPEAEDHNSSSATKDIEHLAHSLRLKPESKLAAICDAATIKTNTHHHQAIRSLSSNLEAVAWTEDGIIEAVEGKGTAFVIGVQSHPESLVARAETRWLKLFRAFVQAAESKHPPASN